MPAVSVITPAYNSGKYIAETITSVLNQSLQDFEMIIVDDASSDNTRDEILKFKDPRIRLICLKQNGGVSNARNIALAESSGAYLQLLDADDVLDRRKLEIQHQRLASHPAPVIATSKWGRFSASLEYVDFRKSDDWQDLDAISFAALKFGGGGMMPPNAWMIPRNLTDGIQFVSSVDTFEDGLFLATILERSRKVIFCEEAVSYYRSQNPRSLTAQRSVELAARQFMSNNMISDRMLRMSQDDRMRVAVANLLLRTAVDIVPYAPNLATLAEQRSRRVGIASWSPYGNGRGLYGKLAPRLGWRLASRLRRFRMDYSRSRTNLA